MLDSEKTNTNEVHLEAPLPSSEPQQNSIQADDLLSPSFFKEFTRPYLFIIAILISHALYLNNLRFSCSLLYDIFLMFFVWFPIGNTLIRLTGRKRYILLALINSAVVFFGMFMLPDKHYYPCLYLQRTPFALFEVILFTSMNKEQSTSLCFIKIPNRYFRFIIFLLTWLMNECNVQWLAALIYAIVFEMFVIRCMQKPEDAKEYFKDKALQLLRAIAHGVKVITGLVKDKLSQSESVAKIKGKIASLFAVVQDLDKTSGVVFEDINGVSNEQIEKHFNSDEVKSSS